MGDVRAGLIGELFALAWGDASDLSSGDPAQDLIEAAAFQLALWEIVYEYGVDGGEDGAFVPGSLDVESGDTYFTGGWFLSDALDLAQYWLDMLAGDVPPPPGMVGYGSPGAQDQVTMMVVPLPAPLALAGVGLLGVVFGRRRLARAMSSNDDREPPVAEGSVANIRF